MLYQRELAIPALSRYRQRIRLHPASDVALLLEIADGSREENLGLRRLTNTRNWNMSGAAGLLRNLGRAHRQTRKRGFNAREGPL